MSLGISRGHYAKEVVHRVQRLFVVLVAAALVSCGAPGTNEPINPPPVDERAATAAVDVGDLEPIEVSPVEHALIIFLVGDVWIERAGGEVLAEIGETFFSGETLTTTDGYAELQVGTLGTLRIQEHSVVRLDDIALSLGASHVDLRVVQGGLLNRVERLATGDSYEVRTETAVMGVRGTQFGVFVGEDQQTRLAVREGRVAVVPPAADADALRRRAAEGEDAAVIEAAIQALEALAPVVEADQEVALTRAEAESGSLAVAELDAVLEELSAADTDAAAATEEILAAVERSMTVIVAETDRNRSELAAESRAELEEIDEVRALPVAAREEERAVLIPVTLVVEPAEAEVLLNGTAMGAGRLSALFSPGESIEFLIRSDGYREQTLQLTVDPERGREYRVRLAPLDAAPQERASGEDAESAVSEEAPPDDEEPAAEVASLARETVPLSVVAQPSDAVVRFDERVVGNGVGTQPFAPGSSVSVRVTRPGYAEAVRTVAVEERAVELTIRLEAQPVERTVAVAATPLVRGLVSDGSAAYGADREGTVYAVSPDGTVLWRVPTSNGRNENSIPVVTGGLVAFSGAGELVFIRAADGVVVGRRTLVGGEAHLFGRRVSPSGISGGWFLPTDEALIPIDGTGADAGAPIALPAGSKASAAVVGDTIVTADQNGAAVIIDRATGAVEATIPTTASQPIALAPTVGGAFAYYVGRRGVAVAIELETRSVAWERAVADGRGSFVDPVLAAGLVWYLIDDAAVAIEASTGVERYTLTDAAGAPLPVGEHLFYATTGGELRRVDPASGRTTARVELPAAATGAPASVGERILVPLADGRVAVIHPAGL